MDYDYGGAGYLSQVTNEVGHVTEIASVNGRGQPTSSSTPSRSTVAAVAVARLQWKK